jgi:deoxyuridine 5'-triphosphate nucleotidohydrolase
VRYIERILSLLCSAYDCVIPARGKGIAETDLCIAIPSGTYARVAPRSGLAVKHFIDTGAGVVDEDYRGNVGVVLFNHSDTDFNSEFVDWMLLSILLGVFCNLICILSSNMLD